MGPDGATCNHFLKEEPRDITKEAWDLERFGMICEKAEVFADWKADIEKLCSNNKKCTYDGQALTALVEKILNMSPLK